MTNKPKIEMRKLKLPFSLQNHCLKMCFEFILNFYIQGETLSRYVAITHTATDKRKELFYKERKNLCSQEASLSAATQKSNLQASITVLHTYFFFSFTHQKAKKCCSFPKRLNLKGHKNLNFQWTRLKLHWVYYTSN